MLRRKRKTAKTSLRFEVVDGKFRRYPNGREVCLDTEKGKAEYRARTLSMRTRQLNICAECYRWMDEHDTTFDHDIPRGSGGAFRDDRIWLWPDAEFPFPKNRAVHLACNTKRGSRRL